MSSGEIIELWFFMKFIQFLSPLVFYISISYFTNPDFSIHRKGLLYLMMPSIYLSLLILENILANDFRIVLTVFLIIHGFVFIFFSFWLIIKHKRHIQQFASSTVEIDLAWLEGIVWAALVLIVGISIFNLLFFDAPLNLFMNGFVYIVVLSTAYHSLKQKEIFPTDIEERAEVLSIVNQSRSDSTQTKIIADEKLLDIKAQLNDLITQDEIFLDNDLNLGKLAKKLNITSHQLSYVINNGFNQNFYGFINKFRVEKAKKLLTDKELDKYSIIGIAFESGFNSKTSFNTTFKKLTGQTPSEFKKHTGENTSGFEKLSGHTPAQFKKLTAENPSDSKKLSGHTPSDLK
jgi:AraC-like DNA-binding protein